MNKRIAKQIKQYWLKYLECYQYELKHLNPNAKFKGYIWKNYTLDQTTNIDHIDFTSMNIVDSITLSDVLENILLYIQYIEYQIRLKY